MTDERKQIELSPDEYRQPFDRPLASPKHLRWSLAVFLTAAIAGALFCGVWASHIWWLPLLVVPIAMWAGAALAGLWPNLFFGSNPNRDDFT